MPSVQIIKQVNRLKVFRELKAWMETHHECPTALQIAEIVSLSPRTVIDHINALRGATGLPMPIPSGNERREQNRQANPQEQDFNIGSVANGSYDPSGPVSLVYLIKDE